MALFVCHIMSLGMRMRTWSKQCMVGKQTEEQSPRMYAQTVLHHTRHSTLAGTLLCHQIARCESSLCHLHAASSLANVPSCRSLDAKESSCKVQYQLAFAA